MPRKSLGPQVQNRTRHLLKSLLDYVEVAVDSSASKIQFRWHDEEPELTVKTELRFLENLTAQPDATLKLSRTQVREALERLADFLEILGDHRTQTRGVAEWHFTLKLWSKDINDNIVKFDQAWEKKRSPKSKAVAKTVEVKELDTAQIYNDRGVEYYQTGELDKALEMFNCAIKLRENYSEAFCNRGSVYEEWSDFDRAYADYEAAIEGNLIAPHNNLARLCIVRDKNYHKAANLISKALKLVTSDTDIVTQYTLWKNLGWARLGQARWDEAVMALEEAIELCSDRAPAYALLAKCYEVQDNLGDAVKNWEKFLRYASTLDFDEDAWIAEARCYLNSYAGLSSN